MVMHYKNFLLLMHLMENWISIFYLLVRKVFLHGWNKISVHQSKFVALEFTEMIEHYFHILGNFKEHLMQMRKHLKILFP